MDEIDTRSVAALRLQRVMAVCSPDVLSASSVPTAVAASWVRACQDGNANSVPRAHWYLASTFPFMSQHKPDVVDICSPSKLLILLVRKLLGPVSILVASQQPLREAAKCSTADRSDGTDFQDRNLVGRSGIRARLYP